MEIPDQLARDVCHFVGTNSDDPGERNYVISLIQVAYADLLGETGVNWLENETAKYEVALEVMRCNAYFSYSGHHDVAKNTEHLDRFIYAKTINWEYSSERVQARREAHG